VRNFESAAIAPVIVFAFLGIMSGGGRGLDYCELLNIGNPVALFSSERKSCLWQRTHPCRVSSSAVFALRSQH